MVVRLGLAACGTRCGPVARRPIGPGQRRASRDAGRRGRLAIGADALIGFGSDPATEVCKEVVRLAEGRIRPSGGTHGIGVSACIQLLKALIVGRWWKPRLGARSRPRCPHPPPPWVGHCRAKQSTRESTEEHWPRPGMTAASDSSSASCRAARSGCSDGRVPHTSACSTAHP